ncbi:MAG TPA: hypothetical protein P5148_04730 [Anaerolineae bacterium]|nr:hypothetical protein [Anaerolineae bacterium]
MRRSITAAAFVVVLVIASLAIAGCVGLPQNSQGSTAPLGVEEATFPVIDVHRSGGPDSVDDRAVMYLDGHVVLERAGDDPVTFQLSAAAQSQIDAAFEAANFFDNTRTALTPSPVPDDATAYEISRHGLLLQGSLTTSDATAPEWARPLIPLLTNLLLSPDPATVSAYQPEQPTAIVSVSTSTPAPTPAAPSMLLISFTRSGAAGDERVLVNLDRSYSVARGGQVTEGRLTEQEMATLLKTLEDANLREQAGDYFSETDCGDCATYELVYRNLFGEHILRTATGQEPEWALPALDALTAQFLPELPAVAAQPSATLQLLLRTTDTPSPEAALTVTATATPAATAAATSSATPTAAAQPTASPTPAALATTAAAVEYSTLDLLADLAALGAQVDVAPGRVFKPYLTTYGLIVRVDGDPIQVFQYSDEASLLADVAGLDATATSINGQPLVWPGAPHFWSKGGVLVLAVTDDQEFVDLISQVLGTPFAGQP